MSKYNFEWGVGNPKSVNRCVVNEIVVRHKNGEPFSIIGKSLGISRQRAHQIYKKEIKEIRDE